MVLFVAINIANVRFFWAMVSQAQFLPIHLLFLCQFVDDSISLRVVPPCSRWFQVVLAYSRQFQLVIGSSSSLQVVIGYCSFQYVQTIIFIQITGVFKNMMNPGFAQNVAAHFFLSAPCQITKTSWLAVLVLIVTYNEKISKMIRTAHYH